MTLKTFKAVALLFVVLLSTVVCYPNGAGGCTGGKAAVGGEHTSASQVLSRTLAQKGVKVSVGGVTIAAGGTGVVAYGKTQTIKITGSNMEGVLIRVQAPSGVSTSKVLTAGSGLKVTSVCKSPVVGVTQKSSSKVSSYSSTINFPTSTKGVILDITIVYSTGRKSSEHAYGRVKVDFTKKRRL